MKKTILFPTDFNIDSLNMLKMVLSENRENHVFDIILLHGIHLNDSITDLLFYSKSEHLRLLCSREFDEACSIIRNKFESNINSIRTDLFTGKNQASFNSYIEANRIDEVYLPVNYMLKLNNKKSKDITELIKKSPVYIHEISWKPDQNSAEKSSKHLLHKITSN